MSTVIFLSNRDVKAVTGAVRGGRVTVSEAFSAQAPEGSIINGQVIDEEAFDDFLAGFWEENKLPKKDVVLVLGSSQAVTRILQVPKMSHRKLMEYLPREFASSEERNNPAFGYADLGREGTMVNLSATMIGRGDLEPHLRRFKHMGVRLRAMGTSTTASIMAMDQLSYLKGETCIVQLLDGMSLINILYVDGKYFQYNSSRIFGERGTPAFGIECARSISNLQQFLKTQQVEEVITSIYLGGEFRDEDVDICRESILQMDDSLKVDKLYEEENGSIRFRTEDNAPFDQYAALAGGFLIPHRSCNLLYQYYRDPETLKQRQELIRFIAPAAAAFVLFAAIGISQAVIWFSRTEQVNLQFDYLGNQEAIEAVAEYDRLTLDNASLSSRISIVSRSLESLNSYPVFTSGIKQAIAECAAGVASAEITEFEQVSGMISVDASSANPEGAYQFVDRLESRSDLFSSVYYNGFQYDERSGRWKASVKCYLAGQNNTQEEVAP